MSAAHAHPDKADLRRHTLHTLRSLPPQERSRRSALVRDHLLSSEVLERATGVALYLSLPDEVELDPLLEVLESRGKRLWLPRVDAPRAMRFCAFRPGDTLEVARLGVRQPVAEAVGAAPGDIDLILVPGVAFDRRGFRLGRGAGHYDRTLPALREAACFVGVGFSEQLVDRLPTDPWDCPMDLLVSDEGVLAVEKMLFTPPGAGDSR